MLDVDSVGLDWAGDQVEGLTDYIKHLTPVEFSELHRYLPASVSAMPGPMSLSVTPYMREILNCADPESPIWSWCLMKGVQLSYTTILESIIFYMMAHIKTKPMMYVTADGELARIRISNNILPMLKYSNFEHIIQANDSTDKRKTGQTKDQIQHLGGGYLLPHGAINANKLQSASIEVLIKDEVDGWPHVVGVGGKDGDPMKLVDARTNGFASSRKIMAGGTPKLEVNSKIYRVWKAGDQRYYMVLCFACGYAQHLRWEKINEETGVTGGLNWDYGDNGILIEESVRYCCENCSYEHFEYDKHRLFSEEHGAHWKPHSIAAKKNTRSYHLSGLYSPPGMNPWHSCVSSYLEAVDTEADNKVKDITAYQYYYNFVLGWPFKMIESKVTYRQVSQHRRIEYSFGEIPNIYALESSGSKIVFLTCQVDVHKSNLALAVMGWTRDMRCYLIDYYRIKPTETVADCGEPTSSVWGEVQTVIEEKVYTDEEGLEYRIAITVIDAGFASGTVKAFCAKYEAYVYPIFGRDDSTKNQAIKEFAKFTTGEGRTGFRVNVNHYKDRIAIALRREWTIDLGAQPVYHFNAPTDVSQKQLEELTKETRVEVTDNKGRIAYEWKRKSGARNELWDLLVYGHAAVEIFAWLLCVELYETDTVDWNWFWDSRESEVFTKK